MTRHRINREWRRAPAGFSLIELLVATTVLALMMVLLVTLITGTSDTSTRVGDHLISSSDASSLLDIVESDLRSTQRLTGDHEWLRIDNDSTTFGAAGAYTNSTLYLITRSLDTSYDTSGAALGTGPGLPRAVRYTLRMGSLLTPGEDDRVGFYRSVAGRDDPSGMEAATFTDYLDLENLASQWNVDQPEPLSDDLLSDAVLNFRVDLVYSTPDGSSANSPATANSIVFRGEQVLIDGASPTGNPLGLEIHLEVIPSQLMQRIGVLSSGPEFSNRHDRDVRRYSRFIPFKTHR